MADGDKGKDARRTLTKQDSGIFLPSADTTPLTPFRPEFSLAANFRELAITEEMESPRVSSKPPLARHRSLTEISPLDEASSEEDGLVSAFNCRKARGAQDWGEGCGHARCKSIRTQWEHLKLCALTNMTTSCSRCAEFQKMVLDHARMCSDANCNITLCSDAKRQLEQYRLSSLPSANYNGRRLIRSSSFTMTSSASTRVVPTPRGTTKKGLGLPATNDSTRNMLTSAGIGTVPLGLTTNPSGIKIRAEEIVSRLEQEELTLPRPATLQSKPAPAAMISKASTIGMQDVPFQSGVVAQGMLSPIAEQPSHEYTPTPSPLSTSPKEELSEKQLGGVVEPAYIAMVPEECLEQYPIQEVLHNFNRKHLTPGEDGHYLEHRNYLLNDVQPLGEGGFGTCVPGQDLRTQKMFALKRNNRSDPDKIASIRSECTVFSRLRFHENVVQCWGAVLDEDVTRPVPRVVKMMMELAENGSLYDMLKDEDKNPAPLPVDQSLYYLEQILQGVHFLHISNVLHLDIKAANVLVFNNGRTVKLADFGSAMHMDDVSSIAVGSLKGCSPHFAAPEVIWQHQPTFSADIWSTACVLIEMLTANLPGCYKIERNHHSMMFLVGNYTDDELEQLVPIQELQLDSSVVDLFRLFLRRNPRERPTALHLLQHVPCIASACEYEKYFDLEYEEEEYPEYEEEESFTTAPTSLPLGPPAPLECNPSNPDKSGHRVSVDSGVGSFRPDMIPLQRSSTGRSSGDSGFETPMGAGGWAHYGGHATSRQESILEECSLPGRSSSCPADTACMNSNPYRRRSSSCTQSTQSHPSVLASHRHMSSWGRSYEDNCEFHSLPANSKVTDQFRCLSLDQHRGSVQLPLFHSNSAPAMSELQRRRRLSLGAPARSESWQGERYGVPKQTNLRRTSSEVYVDRGPDIDTPEEKKQAWLQLQQPMPTSSASSASEEHSLPSHSSSCSSYISAPSSIDTASSVSLDGVVTSSLHSAQEGGPSSQEKAQEIKRPENEADTKKNFRHII